MPRSELRSIVDKVTVLPTLPEIATLVLKLLDDPKSSGQEVQGVIIKDVALASQILKLVNSAYFGMPNRVSDLTQAIVLLGFRQIRNIVLMLSFARMVKTMGRKRRQDLDRLWRHCAVCAGLARRVALKNHKVNPDEAFVAGLTHDIGKLVLLRYSPKDYAEIVSLAKAHGKTFEEAEPLVLKTNHAEIGGWLGEKWQLAPSVVHAIKYHHTPEQRRKDDLTCAVYFADYASITKNVACAGTEKTDQLDIAAWERLGISQDGYFELMGAAESESEIANLIIEAACSEKD
jgi:HD-like signal output (HDOD) protein